MQNEESIRNVEPFMLDHTNTQLSVSQQIANEMENRRKIWLKDYKEKLEINDILELRNP